MDTGRKLKALEKAFADHLYTTHKLSLWENRTLGPAQSAGRERGGLPQALSTAAATGGRTGVGDGEGEVQAEIRLAGHEIAGREAGGKAGGSWLGWIFRRRRRRNPTTRSWSEKRRKLTTDYQSKVAEIAEKWKRVGEEATAIQVKPRKADVHVTHFGLAWAPYWRMAGAGGQAKAAPAYR